MDGYSPNPYRPSLLARDVLYRGQSKTMIAAVIVETLERHQGPHAALHKPHGRRDDGRFCFISRLSAWVAVSDTQIRANSPSMTTFVPYSVRILELMAVVLQ